MKAVIMAGGFGTRLRPLTINLSKPIVPVGNVPIMDRVVALLARHGITEITSLLYFQPDRIKEHFGDGSAFGVKMSYALPDEDYGTAGAVRFGLGQADETALVISGDLITDFDLTKAIDWHKEKSADASLLLTRMENPLPYGIVITDENGQIVRFLEKPSWGEAFSDTINTGIYILEPSALDLIPAGKNFDFSQDLFPLMLKRKMALYGKVMDGYWRDIGNLNEYQRVHDDLFDGRLAPGLGDAVVSDGLDKLFRGKNVIVGDDVELTGHVILGDDVHIDSRARLHNCSIGERTQIGADVELKNSIIWSDSVIGEKTIMNRAIVCRNTILGRNVQLLDNAIISDECVVGESATVKAGCRIWPGKKVDAGATVSTSMVWGEKWNRELFTNSKISGLALTEITPEMAVRVGAAFGAFLGQGSPVVVSRDASDNSRLLKRGLIAGLLAAGVNVSDLETLPVPVVRYSLTKGHYNAGIYVRHNPLDYRQIDFIFFDGNGVDMPTAKLKKVERMYFGEDFERASLDNIGHLDSPQHLIEEYRADFISSIDVDVIREAGFKVVIDHSNGSSSEIFPTLFYKLGITAIELNASLNPRKFSSSPEESAQAVVQMSSIVSSLNADIGLLLNPAAEKLSVVDERGRPVDSQVLLLIVVDLFCRTSEIKKVAVPVSASMGVEEIAARHGVEVIRIPNNHLSMMDIHRRGEVDLVGGTRGGFIFPGFQLGADAMLAAVKILEMLAKTKSRIGDLRREYERFHLRSVSVPCPWAKKGTVMRKMITGSKEKQRQLIDGVRIFENGGWVLVVPDQITASVEITAESLSKDETSSLISRYQSFVSEYQAD